MRERNAVEIEESEIPHKFIQKVQDDPDAFGVDVVAEVCTFFQDFIKKINSLCS